MNKTSSYPVFSLTVFKGSLDRSMIVFNFWLSFPQGSWCTCIMSTSHLHVVPNSSIGRSQFGKQGRKIQAWILTVGLCSCMVPLLFRIYKDFICFAHKYFRRPGLVNVSYIPASGTVACIFYQVFIYFHYLIVLWYYAILVSIRNIWYIFIFFCSCVLFLVPTQLMGLDYVLRSLHWTLLFWIQILYFIQFTSVMLGRPEILQGKTKQIPCFLYRFVIDMSTLLWFMSR